MSSSDADAYDRFMGRYSRPLAVPFADFAGLPLDGRVLDVGCGTGALLRGAREAGHAGRLCGLDPAAAMLQQARRRSDVDWVLGDLASFRPRHAFDLVVMTGHASQVLVGDDEVRSALAAIRRTLTPEGRFAFETRNPRARAWEQWTPDRAAVVCVDGVAVRMAHRVEQPYDGRTVSFTSTFSSPAWDEPRVSRSTLRFVDEDELAGFLSEAGFAVDEQFGDWDGSALTDTSPEIITIARPD